MQVERLPVDLLPTVTLLTVIGVRRYEQQIVDDYLLLLRRMRTAIDEADVTRTLPETGERFDHPSFSFVSAIVFQYLEEERGAPWLEEFPEARYMIEAYEELVGNDISQLFDQQPSATGKPVRKKTDTRETTANRLQAKQTKRQRPTTRGKAT